MQLVVVFVVSTFTKLIFSLLNILPQSGEECELCKLIKIFVFAINCLWNIGSVLYFMVFFKEKLILEDTLKFPICNMGCVMLSIYPQCEPRFCHEEHIFIMPPEYFKADFLLLAPPLCGSSWVKCGAISLVLCATAQGVCWVEGNILLAGHVMLLRCGCCQKLLQRGLLCYVAVFKTWVWPLPCSSVSGSLFPFHLFVAVWVLASWIKLSPR